MRFRAVLGTGAVRTALAAMGFVMAGPAEGA
jgi:hypothetical protein